MHSSTFISLFAVIAWLVTGSSAMASVVENSPAADTATASEMPDGHTRDRLVFSPSPGGPEMQLVATVIREAPSCPAGSVTLQVPSLAITEPVNDSLPGPIIAAMLVSGVFLLVPQKRRFL